MTSDNQYNLGYRELMEQSGAYLTLKLDLSEPVEALDFAQAFSSLAAQFDDYLRDSHPDLVGQAKIFITDVSKGSIIIDMIPDFQDVINNMDRVLIVTGFLSLLSKRVRAYVHGQFIDKFNKPNLNTVASLFKAVAHDKNGTAKFFTGRVEEKGLFSQRKLQFSFDTREARTALATIESHKLLLEQTTGADHSRVSMTFVRSSTMGADLGKRSGELVVIEAVGNKPLPLIYASDLAEQQIKHVIREDDENVFKKVFVVDANVEQKGGRPIAYRITNLHQVIDLPDED